MEKSYVKLYSISSIALIIVLSLLSWKLRFNVDTDLYKWIFSSIIQGFLALVAIFGSLGIYRIANLKNVINDSTNNAKKALESFRGIDLERQLKSPHQIVEEVDEFVEYYNKDIKRLMPNETNQKFLKLAEQESIKIKETEDNLQSEIGVLINSSSPVLILVAITLIIFPFTDHFSNNFVGASLLSIVTLGSIYILINLYFSIRKYLN